MADCHNSDTILCHAQIFLYSRVELVPDRHRCFSHKVTIIFRQFRSRLGASSSSARSIRDDPTRGAGGDRPRRRIVADFIGRPCRESGTARPRLVLATGEVQRALALRRPPCVMAQTYLSRDPLNALNGSRFGRTAFCRANRYRLEFLAIR